jgi:hypothetical protein
MLYPSHPPWFYHPNTSWWIVQIMKLLIMQPSPASRYFLALRSHHTQCMLVVTSWILAAPDL